MKIHVHGQFEGYWSNACVSRGYACGLQQRGHDVTVSPEPVEGLWAPVEVLEDDLPDVGCFVGYPAMAFPPLAQHRVKVGCFIAESIQLPAVWGFNAGRCDIVAVPSRWLALVMINAGVPEDKIVVVPHGLHPCYAHAPMRMVHYEPMKFLHIAGARDFLERKGTPQLMAAFEQVFGAGGPLRDVKAQLTIRAPFSPQINPHPSHAHLFHQDFHTEALTPQAMRQYLIDGNWAAIIQPSRAEAFGLVPCEARALGFPVILTRCTGHSEHVEPWDTVIESGPAKQMASNGIPNGAAPTVDRDAIADALVRFVQNYKDILGHAARGAKGYYETLTWNKVTAPLAERIMRVCDNQSL